MTDFKESDKVTILTDLFDDAEQKLKGRTGVVSRLGPRFIWVSVAGYSPFPFERIELAKESQA